MLRKIVLFCLLGFLSMVLFGPVVAVLSVVLSFATVILSFALVGFLIYFLLHAILYGRQSAMESTRGFGEGLRRVVPAVGDRVLRVIRFPFRVAGGLLYGLKQVAWFAVSRTWLATRFVGSLVPVAATGVLVGAVVGTVMGAPTHDFAVTVPANALFGGLMGVGVGVAMAVMERRSAVRPTSHALS